MDNKYAVDLSNVEIKEDAVLESLRKFGIEIKPCPPELIKEGYICVSNGKSEVFYLPKDYNIFDEPPYCQPTERGDNNSL